ncbi:MAG: hypothetical protein QT00_C0002G0057 [archaeon GW2011_AR5]|nr:MAG: hypothetical protein QT00_C0002G0057 [archaeon GW2011_AR5]
MAYSRHLETKDSRPLRSTRAIARFLEEMGIDVSHPEYRKHFDALYNNSRRDKNNQEQATGYQ